MLKIDVTIVSCMYKYELCLNYLKYYILGIFVSVCFLEFSAHSSCILTKASGYLAPIMCYLPTMSHVPSYRVDVLDFDVPTSTVSLEHLHYQNHLVNLFR